MTDDNGGLTREEAKTLHDLGQKILDHMRFVRQERHSVIWLHGGHLEIHCPASCAACKGTGYELRKPKEGGK